MPEIAMKIVIMGLCAIVLDGGLTAGVRKQATILMLDNHTSAGHIHNPLLVLDFDQIDQKATSVSNKLPQAPYLIPNPGKPGRQLLVWPLDEQKVSFTSGIQVASGAAGPILSTTNLALLPDMGRAAPGAAIIGKDCLRVNGPCPVASVITLPPGGSLSADPFVTPKTWCYFSQTGGPVGYEQQFSLVGNYSVLLQANELQLQIDYLDSQGNMATSTVRLEAKTGDREIVIGLSNEPAQFPCPPDDSLQVRRFYELSATPLGPGNQPLPIPLNEQGKCKPGGGAGCELGVGCSPHTMYEE